MEYLPIFLDLKNRPCLLVGGGGVAHRKAVYLTDAGARLTVVALELSEELQALAHDKGIFVAKRAYQSSDVDGMQLVIAATADQSVNSQVYKDAKSQGILVNVVDQPELCDFIVPSIINRDPMQIAVSTGGASPVLARLLRARLETVIPQSYGKLAALCNDFRQKVKDHFANVPERRAFWEEVLQGPIAEMVFSGRESQARAALQKRLDQPHASKVGEVYLVGGGPGDPDLLTFKALRLMQQADVIVYDRLVSPAEMELCRKDAEQIYVGKERDNHSVPQEDINHLLARLAKEGKRVCRLKGGDPFIFGRGGEEIETLVDEGIPFQVVPGITAASGCACYSGIPLTHRDYSQSCIFVTGHLKDGTMDLNWKALAQENQTIVFYMGLQGVPVLSQKLIEHGLSPDTPVALVQKGTTPDHKVYTSTLAGLPDKVAHTKVKPPTLIIVGNVVKLQEKLSWFNAEGERRSFEETMPLEEG